MERRRFKVVAAVTSMERCPGGSVSAGKNIPRRSFEQFISFTDKYLQPIAVGAVYDRPSSSPVFGDQF
jgi:hypothetical protein